MKKKFLRVIISSLLISFIPIGISSVSAANGDPIISPATENSTEITASVTKSYTITIPTSYAFGTITKSNTSEYVYKEGDVTVSNHLLEPGEYLHVACGTNVENDYKITNTANAQTVDLAYDFFSYDDQTSQRTPIPHGSNVININNASTDADLTATCHVGIDRQNITAAGNYSGTLKFTVTLDQNAT